MLQRPKSFPAKKTNQDSYLPGFKRKVILALLYHKVVFIKVWKGDLRMSIVVEDKLDKSHKPPGKAVPLMNTQQGSVMTFSQVIVWAGHIRRDRQTVKDEDNKNLKHRSAEKYSCEREEKVNDSSMADQWTEMDKLKVKTRHEREACRG